MSDSNHSRKRDIFRTGWDNLSNRLWKNPETLTGRIVRKLSRSLSGGLLIFVLRQLLKYHLVSQKTISKINLYPSWIRSNEPKQKDLIIQKRVANSLSNPFLVSIVMVAVDENIPSINLTIASLQLQTYPFWELCVTLPGNRSISVSDYLGVVVKNNPQIKVGECKSDAIEAELLNAAVGMATGSYIGFVDPGDQLAPFTLYEIAGELRNSTSVDLIYSDEDAVSSGGKRNNPFFKPNFSPDLMRSMDYMSRFLVVNRQYGFSMGWFTPGFDGKSLYEFGLRAAENRANFLHIPKVFYHRAVSPRENVDNQQTGRKALEEYLKRNKIIATVSESGNVKETYRVNYKLDHTPLVSIIIPNHDHHQALEICVNSILKLSTYQHFEILIVENGSKNSQTFELYERLGNDHRIRIKKWTNPFNYSTVNNWAVEQSTGEVLLFLNNDIQVISPDWIEQMLQYAVRPDVGAVGAMLYYPDDTIQHAGVIIGLGKLAGHSHRNFPRNHPGTNNRLKVVQNLSAVTAACLMVRKRVFQEVNGFDPDYILAYGDVDLCLRIFSAGYLNVWTPYAELYHHESQTRGLDDTPEKKIRFNYEANKLQTTWASFMQRGDPYYNPNLTLYYEDFAIEPRKIKAFSYPPFI